MDALHGEQQIARISLTAKVEFLPAVMAFVHEASIRVGLSDSDAERFELVVEEACVNVIEHAFEADEQGSFDVIVLRRPGQVVVAVEDQGLPFDFKKLETEKESGLGTILMRAFADEVHFLNLGRKGKRVELAKNLPYKDIESYVSKNEKERSLSLPLASNDIEIAVRLMKPEDSVNLARCIYRCYGYTYPIDYIYYPDRVREFLESGLLLSYVAVDPDGEVIGHIAIRRDRPEAQVGEGGQAVVDPRYRGHGFLGKLVISFADYAKTRGICGAYSEAVTVHPFSQKAAISLGGYETGVLLGFLPDSLSFKKIKEDFNRLRQTAILLYTSVNGEPQRDVYPPFHHEAVIRHIYGRGSLKRNIISALDAKEPVEVPPYSQVDVRVNAEVSQAYMQVIQYGADLEELVKFRLKELCLRRIDCIYVDLPLSDRAIQKFGASLEILGFFFAGIIPEMARGDILRLQYLNNVNIDNENIQIASDFGKELLDYVIKAKEHS